MIKNLYKIEKSFEGTCNIKFLDSDIDVEISNGVPIKYVDACINMLNSLSDNVIDDLCKYSIRCFEDFKRVYELDSDDCLKYHDVPEKVDGREILKYISPVKMQFKTVQNINVFSVDVHFDCKWEYNYGMEWVIRDSKIIYVGFYEGVGAWVEDGYAFGNYVLNEHPFD